MSQILEAEPVVRRPLLLHRPAPVVGGARWEPSAFERACWLRALREDYLRSLTTGIAGRPRVALYVLVKTGGDPSDRRAVAQAHADKQGCEVTQTYIDDAWMSDPALRPALACAHAALRRGEIDGIVAVSRVDISSCDELYEQELRFLRCTGGFLSLALDETCL